MINYFTKKFPISSTADGDALFCKVTFIKGRSSKDPRQVSVRLGLVRENVSFFGKKNEVIEMYHELINYRID